MLVRAAGRASVCMLVGIMSGCMFIYVCNRICTVIHPLIVCVCVCKLLIDSVTFFV